MENGGNLKGFLISLSSGYPQRYPCSKLAVSGRCPTAVDFVNFSVAKLRFSDDRVELVFALGVAR